MTLHIADSSGKVFSGRPGKIREVANLPRSPETASSSELNPWQITAIHPDTQGLVLLTRYRGAWRRDRDSWTQLPGPEQRQVDFDNGLREITGWTRNFISHKQSLISRSKGSLRTNLGRAVHITSLYEQGDTLYAGTGVNGLLSMRIKDTAGTNKLEFREDRTGLPYIRHDQSSAIYEEIRSIASGIAHGSNWLCVGTGFTAEVYCRRAGEIRFSLIHQLPAGSQLRPITGLGIQDNRLWIATQERLASIPLNGTSKVPDSERQEISLSSLTGGIQDWTAITMDIGDGIHISRSIGSADRLPAAKTARMQTAAGKRLLYSSPYQFDSKLPRIRKALQCGKYNGLVFDVKDDSGILSFDSQIPLAIKAGASRRRVDVRALAAEFRKNNWYLVARMVVFKDPELWKLGDYASIDVRTGKPWVGNGAERWINPYHPGLATDYFVPLAQEIQNLGFSELQLDYIRFPSDGEIQHVRFPFRKENQYLSEALENFIYRIRNSVSIPISADIYGYNGIYRTSGVIGQDAEAYGNHLDVICPMSYSSHFGDLYLTDGPRDQRAYRLLYHSGMRSMAISNGNYLVRPWLQAFRMKAGLWGSGPRYIRNQVQATMDAGLDGYSFWGSMDDLITAGQALGECN